MNCRDFEADIVDLARGEDLSGATARCLGDHLEKCPGCAARFESERRLTAQLRALAGSAPESPRAAAVEQQLLRVFAERRTAAVEPGPASRSVFPTHAAWRWGAAAAALIVAATLWLGSSRWWFAGEGTPVPARASAGSAEPAPVATSATVGTVARAGAQGGNSGPLVDASRTPPRRSTNARVEPAREEEVLRFVTLPAAAGLPTLESGRIVRVELSTAMLPAYGFDVDPDVPSTVVEADVLVGQDGQPRAIRFVSLDSTPRRRQ